jgi:hypothetical protein
MPIESAAKSETNPNSLYGERPEPGHMALKEDFHVAFHQSTHVFCDPQRLFLRRRARAIFEHGFDVGQPFVGLNVGWVNVGQPFVGLDVRRDDDRQPFFRLDVGQPRHRFDVWEPFFRFDVQWSLTIQLHRKFRAAGNAAAHDPLWSR